jgi:ubiquinone/menaquinone biosynthesis C-methylase UbiE/uncharacterized protein YbaR (Trm112 family)
MQLSLVNYLRCPITNQTLSLEIIQHASKNYSNGVEQVVESGILWANDICYPIIEGIPRLLVEAIIDYEDFLQLHVNNFETVKQTILTKHKSIIDFAIEKNKRTKESFALEWGLFNYEEDAVWDLDKDGLLQRFLTETNETKESISGKLILDAGCGNGLLDNLIADAGAQVIAGDFSKSIVRAYQKNTNKNAFFVQCDVEFLPFKNDTFDIIQCSGVIVCTKNTKQSFIKLIPFAKVTGKLSIWLYHPQKSIIHNLLLAVRKVFIKLPLKLNVLLCKILIFPPAFIIKKLKGNPQNTREIMIDILDQFTPQYRWEFTSDEATTWFVEQNLSNIKVTTNEVFGFNIIGSKQ